MENQEVLRWKAPEYLHWDKESDWFWGLGIVAVSAVLIAIMLGNILFAVLIALAAFTLAMYSVRRPDVLDIEINRKGVIVGKYFYPFSTLESFWVEENHGFAKLLLKSKKLVMPYIIVILPEESEIDPEEVIYFLEEHLEEEEHSENIFEKIMERLGF